MWSTEKKYTISGDTLGDGGMKIHDSDRWNSQVKDRNSIPKKKQEYECIYNQDLN